MVECSMDSATLRARLEALEMKQADLARLTGRGPAIISLWCSGKRRVPGYVGRCLDLLAENRRLRRAMWKVAADSSPLAQAD